MKMNAIKFADVAYFTKDFQCFSYPLFICAVGKFHPFSQSLFCVSVKFCESICILFWEGFKNIFFYSFVNVLFSSIYETVLDSSSI